MSARASRRPEELLTRKTVLGLLGLADNGVAALERTRIPAAAHQLREGLAGCLKGLHKEIPVRNVIEVDYRPYLGGLDELLGRRVVRREHDRFAHVSDGLRKDQLSERRAVASEPLFAQDGH